MWYLGILKKGIGKFARKIKLDSKIENLIAEQMSAFNVKPEMVEKVL